MKETAQYFEKRFFINMSSFCIVLSKFYAAHQIMKFCQNNRSLLNIHYIFRAGLCVDFGTSTLCTNLGDKIR
jgi:hypothetical protein